MIAHNMDKLVAVPEGMTLRHLTFIDDALQMDILVDGMAGRDVSFDYLERGSLVRFLSRWAWMPVYFHLTSAGYGVFDGRALTSMMFLRSLRWVLHIEALAVRPKYRRRGLGRAMLRMAEQQARDVNRSWLTLRVTVSNVEAVKLYESEGFERAHYQTLIVDRDALAEGASERVGLRKVVRRKARQAYSEYLRLDLTEGDSRDNEGLLAALMEVVPVENGRWHWVCRVDGQDAGFVRLRGPASAPSVFLATAARWWGTAEERTMLAAALARLRGTAQQVEIRMASSAHHKASLEAMADLNAREGVVAKMAMLKAVDLAG